MLEEYGDFITVKDAARELHISEWTTRNMCRQGLIPSVKIGRRVLIPKVMLIKHITKEITGAESI